MDFTQNKKYKFGILLAATSDSIFTLGTMIANIYAIMGECVDVFYIVSDKILPSDKVALQKVARDIEIKFIPFTKEIFENNFIEFANANKEELREFLKAQNAFLRRWSYMVYACFEAFKYLGECERILYLDFDILLLRTLSHLSRVKEGFALHKGRTKISHNAPLYEGEFRKYPVYRSGIILFTQALANPLESLKSCYKNSFKYKMISDQVAISLLIYENKIKVKNLSYKYTGLPHFRSNDNPYLIHAYGSNNRFWNNRLCNRLFPSWNLYYKEWLESGGSAYKGGFVANTTNSYERFRYHLSYKLGYAIVKNHTFPKALKLLFLLPYITLKHKIQILRYKNLIKKKPFLKLPPLVTYDDYNRGILEKNSISYRLGSALLEVFKGGNIFSNFMRFCRQSKAIYKNKLES
ncbi:MAG: glycosyltransferase [Helicobacter sp.]|nr:glycosyltransferase [Helicobacter sp.]